MRVTHSPLEFAPAIIDAVDRVCARFDDAYDFILVDTQGTIGPLQDCAVLAGDDILLILPISLDEAILGAKVAAPTIDGPVNLTIPKGATSGQKLRLRGTLRWDETRRQVVLVPSDTESVVE